MLAANAMIDKVKKFSQENQNSLAGSMESNVPCISKNQKQIGWMTFCWKNEYKKYIRNSQKRKK